MDTPSPDAVVPTPTDPCERLLRLHELAGHWLTDVIPPPKVRERPEGATKAYSSVMFAFGLARSAAPEPAAKLLGEARQTLGQDDVVAACLFDAFAYRIEQALQARPHGGPLPAALLARIERAELIQRYAVERLLQGSRILEPDQNVDPYRRFRASASKGNRLDGELARLASVADRRELASQLERLFHEAPDLDRECSPQDARARVLKAGLSVAPCVGEEFALRMLSRLGPVYDALCADGAENLEFLRLLVELLRAGLFTAVHFRQLGHAQDLVARFQELMEWQRKSAGVVLAVNLLAGQCFRGLHTLGLRGEIDQLSNRMADLLLESQSAPDLPSFLGKTIEDKDASFVAWVEALRALLHVAASWYSLGQASQAEAVLDAAREVLSQGRLLDRNKKREQMRLACGYVQAAAAGPAPEAQRRFDDLFRQVVVQGSYSTDASFGLSQLCVVEAVVLAVAPLDSSPR